MLASEGRNRISLILRWGWNFLAGETGVRLVGV